MERNDYLFSWFEGAYGYEYVAVDMLNGTMDAAQAKTSMQRRDYTGYRADELIDYAIRLFEENNDTVSQPIDVTIEGATETQTIIVRDASQDDNGDMTEIEIFVPYEPAIVTDHKYMVVYIPHAGIASAPSQYFLYKTKPATKAQIDYAIHYLTRMNVGTGDKINYRVIFDLPKDANRIRKAKLQAYLNR